MRSKNLELLVSDLQGQSSKELKWFVVARISWPARTRELACTMVQWSVKYTRSRAKYWTVWDRNLKHGSFTGKILWKPTEVCLLWYFHATERTCGSVKVYGTVSLSYISFGAQWLIASVSYLRVFCSQIKYYPFKSWKQLLVSAATKGLQVTASKTWVVILVSVFVALFCNSR